MVKSQVSAVISHSLGVARAADIVDQNIDPAVQGQDAREGVLHHRFLGHVARDDRCRAWQRRRCPLQPLRIDIEQHKRCAFLGETFRNGLAYALRRPGDDSDLVA